MMISHIGLNNYQNYWLFVKKIVLLPRKIS